jgi:uncharacterized membrane protein YedE/YeeE
MQTSTLLSAMAGGALIGVGASILLVVHGRIAGIAGICASIFTIPTKGLWRLGFLVGLCGAGVVAAFAAPGALGTTPVSLPLVAVAGVVVGFGTRLGNGCTSGHGVCGLSRLSLRSLAATMTFMVVAAITVAVVRAAGGWS